MAWLPLKDAAHALRISTRAVLYRAESRGESRIERNEEGLYWVDESTPTNLRADRRQPQREPIAPEEIEHDSGQGAAYYFDEGRDVYVFSLRSKAGKPLAVRGDTVRAAVLAYSRDGSDATVNEIARTNAWHRATAREILKALGKTHDSAPFTDEEIGVRDEDELAEDLIRLKEERVIRKAEKRDWENTKRLAEEARHFDRFVARRIEEIIQAGEWAPPAPPVAHPLRTRPAAPLTAVFGLTDAHVGARAWSREAGQDTDIETVRALTIATAHRLIERVCRYGTPQRWLTPVGSDNLHADTPQGTTTKGTRLDTDGSHARMYLAACSLYEELIGILLSVAPVELFAVPGNHDWSSTMMMTHWLGARFRGDPHVRVGDPLEQRSYHLHGKALLGFDHGEKMPDSRLPLVMAAEAPEKWGQARHRVIFTGHLHTDKMDEIAGTRVIHMPTLARNDAWHFGKGYVGNTKAIAAYLIDHEEGLVASLPVQAPGGVA